MSDAERKESKGGAGAAGIGGGTLLVVIANSLPQDNKFRPLLIWAAPSAAVFLGGLWLFIQYKMNNFLRDHEAKAHFDNAKKILREALNNPLTSNEHRQRLQRELETLEILALSRYLDRIKALKPVTEEETILRDISKNVPK